MYFYNKLLITGFKRSRAESVAQFVAWTGNRASQDTEQWLFQLPFSPSILKYKNMTRPCLHLRLATTLCNLSDSVQVIGAERHVMQ